MNASVWIILAIVLFLLFVFFLFFSSKKKKNREEQKQQKDEQNKKLEELRKRYHGKNLFLVWHEQLILDEWFNVIEDFRESYLDGKIHRKSLYPAIIPIKITSIQEWSFDEEYDLEVDYIVRPDEFEFEILYVGVADAIVKSPELGELYLPKRKFLQYEVGKKLKVKFNSRKATDCSLTVVMPEIVKGKNMYKELKGAFCILFSLLSYFPTSFNVTKNSSAFSEYYFMLE